MSVEERSFASFDNTRISYVAGGNPDGPAMVFANGLGGTYVAWKLIAEYFADRFKILCWDYRGTFSSETPRDLATLDVENHVRDCDLMMEREGVKEAVFLGWSMGVQVILEYAGRHPEKARALVPVNGSYGYIFDTAFNWSLSKYVMPFVNLVAMKTGRVFEPLTSFAVDQPSLFALIKKTGMVSQAAREDVFMEVARGFKHLDFSVYFKIMDYLSKHSAEEHLERIACPALVVAGDRDLLTPLKVSETMARRIKDAELFVIPTGTHYTPVEFPEFINLKVEKFLRDRGMLPA